MSDDLYAFKNETGEGVDVGDDEEEDEEDAVSDFATDTEDTM